MAITAKQARELANSSENWKRKANAIYADIEIAAEKGLHHLAIPCLENMDIIDDLKENGFDITYYFSMNRCLISW